MARSSQLASLQQFDDSSRRQKVAIRKKQSLKGGTVGSLKESEVSIQPQTNAAFCHSRAPLFHDYLTVRLDICTMVFYRSRILGPDAYPL